MSWMFMWWASPYNTLSANRFSSSVFDSAYIAPIGYAAFAFALGVAAGVVWRRTVPAMATTLVAFVAVRLSFAHYLRPRLLPPLTKVATLKHAQNIGFERTPTGMSFVVGDANQPNSLLVSSSVVGNHGGTMSSQWLNVHCHALFKFNPPPGKGGPTSVGVRPAMFTDCMNKISASFHQVLTYQPASRFWTFEWIEMSTFILFALLLGSLQLLVGETPNRLERSHLVVTGLVGHFGEAEVLEQGREVHSEAAPVSLAKSIPSTDGVRTRTAPGLDGAVRGRLVLVGGTQGDPVALGDQPGMEVLDRREVVLQRR